MVNNIRDETLLAVVAEWIEEVEIPPLIQRIQRSVEPENLDHILAIVGPRRAGKTYFMYQLIQSLIQGGRYTKAGNQPSGGSRRKSPVVGRILADQRLSDPVHTIAAEYTRRTGNRIQGRLLPADEVNRLVEAKQADCDVVL